MRLPTNNWITCDPGCHGYEAVDYSWHPSKVNYIPRKDFVAIHGGVLSISHSAGTCGKQAKLTFMFEGKEWVYVMCHAEKFYRGAGAVKEGEKIGKMGHTGLPASNGDHLHVYLFINGVRINNPDEAVRKAIKEEEMSGLTTEEVELEHRMNLGRGSTVTERRNWKGKDSLLLCKGLYNNKLVQERIKKANNYDKLAAENARLEEELAKYRNDETITITKDGLWTRFTGWINGGK